jgi:signal transduction histidine kinase
MEGPGPGVRAGPPGSGQAPVGGRSVLPWWHIAVGATVVVTAAVTAATEHPAWRVVVALGLYALLGLWYVVTPWGRRAEAHWGGFYLTGALILFTGAVLVTPFASFLLFVLIPQCFLVLPRRPAWAAILGLSLLSSASQLERSGLSKGDAISVTIFGVMTVVLSVLISGWVTRIAVQSEQRAELIHELDRTRAELAEVSRDAGVAAERARLAGEIHDTMAQGFTSILMLLQTAQAGLDAGSASAAARSAAVPTAVPAAVRTQLTLAEATAREALAEARSFVAALTPAALQSAPLIDAVRRVVEDFGARSGVQAHLEVTGEPRALSAPTEVVLLRATQEALANIHRHAAAHTATVTLAFEAGGSSLTVTDDGRGIEPAVTPGYGLRGMRARVEQVGGRLCIGTAGGAGTTLELHLP